MNVKKQAVRDADMLFEINSEYWTLHDAFRQKALKNPKYDEVFTKTYNEHLAKISQQLEDLAAKSTVKLRRSKKPALVGVALIVTGVIWYTGYDKVLLEKGKHLARKAVLAVEGTTEEEPRHSGTYSATGDVQL